MQLITELTSSAEAQESSQDLVHAMVIRWLSIRDLGLFSLNQRIMIADEIMYEIQATVSSESVTSETVSDDLMASVAVSNVERFQSNIELLMEAWLTGKARRLAELAEDDRLAYVERQLDQILKFPLERLGGYSDSSQATGSLVPASISTWMSRLSVWTERASPEDKPRLRDLILKAQWSFLQRTFNANKTEQ